MFRPELLQFFVFSGEDAPDFKQRTAFIHDFLCPFVDPVGFDGEVESFVGLDQQSIGDGRNGEKLPILGVKFIG